MLKEADLILCMTEQHREEILAESPESAGRIRLYGAGRGIEVEDPVGGPPEAFEACLRTLLDCALDWIPSFQVLARTSR
jgi:protein-tyrosine-phosphatase